mmetsp:Transcript_35522/g.93233  ORF Transcript_35522/g.93233 Transcript_35522/m.93233 type:complete len:80 (+) Transcript_35522:926-1165(+)
MGGVGIPSRRHVATGELTLGSTVSGRREVDGTVCDGTGTKEDDDEAASGPTGKGDDDEAASRATGKGAGGTRCAGSGGG